MKKILIAIILIAALGYTLSGAKVANPSVSEVKPEITAPESIREAITTNLSKSVLVGTSRNSYDDAMKLHRKGDKEQLIQHIKDGRVFEVDGEVAVKIINSDKIYSQIEIMEGPSKGKTGTIYNSMLIEKK